ncbi:MAG: family oxidoreductase [Bacteroidetes bacterium]|uniref:SDR family oxidoreductase n=1 Tax=[Flexibacter] sp. ATCC 35208 TaxID=1936242 RepID=UPI0009D04F81|nr:SDR family oxidoreductase [[Flexibacter] sp. ATCC 35208]MBP1651561.1 family oxidoreductase [Bacteroidota bacterium]OMP78641.1 NAD(P)-dependent oxidoreductase [[Flexibacter] sp. ATCC 35208]
MILITGAAGNLGSAIIDSMLKKVPANQIAAFVRSEQKAEQLKKLGLNIRIGDYNDVASLDNAMKGIDKVLLISGLSLERLKEHTNVVDAAKKAGVKQIVYTGVTMKDAATSPLKVLMESHFQTEDYIRASGITYTFLRNTLYAEVIPFYIGDQALNTGIHYPAGAGKVPYVYRPDLADAAAVVITNKGHENRTYQLTGDHLYSFADVADMLSEVSGKHIGYTDVDPVAFEKHMKEIGVPEVGIMISTGFAAAIKQGDFEVVTGDLEKLLGRKPTPVKQYLKAHYVR